MGNQENAKQWGYMPALAFIVLVIAGQISFFSSDYIWWISYEPLSPLPWDKVSMLTYLTTGSILYHLGFYLFLYRLIVKRLGFRYRDFEIVKDVVWLYLMYLTNQMQIAVVHGLNFLDSLFWNAIRLIVFLWPSWVIIAGSFLALFLVRKLRSNNKTHTVS